MLVGLDKQIEWMERQVHCQRKALPRQVEQNRLTEAEATYELACASSALQTLTQLRGLAGGRK